MQGPSYSITPKAAYVHPRYSFDNRKTSKPIVADSPQRGVTRGYTGSTSIKTKGKTRDL